MRLARHKGRKKTLSLPNRPKPLGVMRSLTDEFVKWGTGNITAPCGGLRPMGRCPCAEGVRLPEGKARAAKRSQEAAQTRRAERVPREQGTGWSLRSLGRVAAKFEQVLRLLRTSSPLAENKFKSCGEQVHFHEGKFPIREERKKDETETT